jgi:hypothetical protein
MAKKSTKNPQERSVNQAQGPRTGNAGSAEKRGSFIKEKTSGFRSELANMINAALTGRGAGMKPSIDPAVEGLHADTGPKRNPTAGGTKYTMRDRAKK